jgi:hypothetical protein
MADPTVSHFPGRDDDGSDRYDDLRKRFGRWDKDLSAHWQNWIDETRESFDFTAGRQWDQEDEQKIRDSNRTPVVFNRVGPMIDSVAGTEIQGRQQVQYLPRVSNAPPVPGPMGAPPAPGAPMPAPPAPIAGPPAMPGAAMSLHPGGAPAGPPGPPQQPLDQQSAVDEILTKGADWIRDQCDAEHEESDAFRDALICGIGWTETRMDYEEDPEGKIIIERIDPLEVLADPRSKKPNFADARYLRRARPYSLEDFEERWPDAQPVGGDRDSAGPTVINDPRHRYEDENVDADDPKDTVTVREWQWYEIEPIHLISRGGVLTALSKDEHQALSDELGEHMPDSVKVTRRRYYRAFQCGSQILQDEELPDGEFTLKAITGKRDRNKGTWYGLVRSMKDPQRWSNKLVSQALHILNTNAKGGLMAEENAFVDARQAEESWAKADAITWMSPGGMERVKPKEAPPFPQSLGMLVEWSMTAIRDSTGINQELLGMTERNQPGILEAHRKESAFAILAPFFDSLRRYRRIQGRLLLKYIQKYLPDGTLVRIVDDQGLAKYVPLAKQPDTVKFDVIVDEGPAGPNEKRRVFELLSQFLPALKDAGPDIWAQLVLWSPLPTTVAQKLSQMLTERASAPPPPPTPEQQQSMAESQAKAARDAAGAQLDQARAQHVQAETVAIETFGPVPHAPGM